MFYPSDLRLYWIGSLQYLDPCSILGLHPSALRAIIFCKKFSSARLDTPQDSELFWDAEDFFASLECCLDLRKSHDFYFMTVL